MPQDHNNIYHSPIYLIAVRYRFPLLLLALSMVCALIYIPAFSVGFLSDDYYALYIFKTEGLKIFFGPEDSVFMPLMMLAAGILFKLFGLHPLMYHVFMLAIHILNAFLLALFIGRLLKYFGLFAGKTFYIASLCAILFAVNPYHTEAVTWIASIGYPLSLFICLCSMLVFLRWMEQQKTWLLVASGLLFFIATLAKEVALTLPGILIPLMIAGYWWKKSELMPRKFFFRAAGVTLFFFALIVIYFASRHYYIGHYIGHYGAGLHLSFTVKKMLAAIISYLAKFFLSYRFLPDTLHAVLKFMLRHLYLAGGIVAVICLLIYYLRKRIYPRLNVPALRLSLLFFVCFIISLIPVLNLELSFLGEIQSDRYGYFSSLFFTATLTFLIFSISDRRMIAGGIAITALVLWFCVLTYGDNLKWKRSSAIVDTFFQSLKDKGVEGKDIYLVNVPDNYKGAYTSRWGIEEGLKLKGFCNRCKVYIVSYLAVKDDIGRITYTTDGNCIYTSNDDGFIKFIPGEYAHKAPGLFYSETPDGGVKICFEGAPSANMVVYFANPDGTLFSPE
jgi:protein O-mannosyl-transferase